MKPVSSQSMQTTVNVQTPASGVPAGTPSAIAPRLRVPPGVPLLFPAGHPLEAASHDERADYVFVGDVIMRGGAPAGRRRDCTIL